MFSKNGIQRNSKSFSKNHSANRENEIWLTFAENDESAKKSLVLLRSLRRVATNRKIFLVLGNGVSSILWEPLNRAFDGIFSKNDYLAKNIELSQLLFAWGLVQFSKIVAIQPNSLALENPDELFELDLQGGLVGKNVFVIQPDFKQSRKLLSLVRENPKIEWKKLFELANIPSYDLDSSYELKIGNKLKLDDKQLLLLSPKILTMESLIFKLNGNGNICDFLQAARELQKEISEEVEHYIKSEGNIPYPPLFEGYATEPIAIIGLSSRMPGCNNLEDFWQLFLDSKVAICDPPPFRWTEQSHKNSNVQAGFLNCPIDEFDAKFFNISPAEGEFIDPQQKLLMEVAWEAFEDAGLPPSKIDGNRTSIYTGSWTTCYRDMLRDGGYENENFRTYLGNAHSTAASRLAHFFGVCGKSLGVEIGCCSSSVAIGLGMESLRSGASDLCVVGGVNLLPNKFEHSEMAAVFSPDNRCKVFDKEANGFARSEGVCVFLLKRLSSAVRDGDKITALLRGFGMSQEGSSRSLGTPTVNGEALAMSLALQDADLKPEQIQKIEAHGTGTKVGDPLEIKAIAEVYSGRSSPLIITSGKANVGHTESCSGMTGILKTMLEMKTGLIPPQLQWNELNPAIKLDEIPGIIPREVMEWKSVDRPRIAGVSSFGLTGGDTHIILEEFRPSLNKSFSAYRCKTEYNSMQLLTLSAKSETALDSLATLYSDYLKSTKGNNQSLSIAELCYAANVGRDHGSMPFRAAVTGKSLPELVDNLKKKKWIKGVAAEGKIGFIFTGQGSQWHGMGKDLYDISPVFKHHFDLCQQFIGELEYDFNLKEVTWGEKDKSAVNSCFNSQVAIFVLEYCLYKVLEWWGITPSLVLGHSLGECCAAVAGGLVGLRDMLKLVLSRAYLLDTLPPGKMIAIKLGTSQAKSLICEFSGLNDSSSKWLDVAAINSGEQTTLSGPPSVVDEFKEFCGSRGIKSTILEANYAFHSREMDPILEPYKKVADNVEYTIGFDGIEFVSTVRAGEILNRLDSEYWVQHTRGAVEFTSAAAKIFQTDCPQTIFLEIGPHSVLSALLLHNAPNPNSLICLPTLRRPTGSNSKSDWDNLNESIAKLFVATASPSINFRLFYKSMGISPSHVPLPLYPFQRKRIWFTPMESEKDRQRIFKVLNPLLGSKIEQPQSEFCNEGRFTQHISTKSYPYIEDHKVGRFVLMPGACFAEIIMAAISHSEKKYPLITEDIVIKAPLVLEKQTMKQIHTILNCNTANSLSKVSVYSKNSGGEAWFCHATGCGSMNPSNDQIFKDTSSIESEMLEVANLKWEGSLPGNELYSKLESFGYNFGPAFQSITKLFKDKEGIGQIAEIKIVQTELGEDSKYVLHPLLMDAVIQSALIYNYGKIQNEKFQLDGFYLPVAVKRVVVLAPIVTGHANIFYVKSLQTSDRQTSVHTIFSAQGSAIAKFEGVGFAKTNLSLMEKNLNFSIGREKFPLPPLGLIEWEPCLERVGHVYNTFKEREFNLGNFIPEMVKSLKLNLKGDKRKEEDEQFKSFTRWIGLGILKNLWDMGLSFHLSKPLGSIFELKELIVDLKVDNKYEKAFRRFVQVLCEDGILQEGENCDQFVLTKCTSPSFYCKILDEIKDIYVECGSGFFAQDLRIANVYINSIGKILRGEMLPQELLFPAEENDETSAYKIYTTGQITKAPYQNLETIWSSILLTLGSEGKALNILEIGAGTGSCTSKIMDCLASAGNEDYFYTFSDISNFFFKNAKEKFGSGIGDRFQTRILNIEEDPKSQGFAPFQYDVLIAANVLHATKNLRETVQNMRHLLKPNGIVLIVEMFGPIRTMDISFSFLPGFWRQNDSDIRPKSCLVDTKTWSWLLGPTQGFTRDTFTSARFLGLTGIVVAQASDFNMDYFPLNLPLVKKRKRWLIILPSAAYEPTNQNFALSLKLKFESAHRSAVILPCSSFSDWKEAEIEGVIYSTLDYSSSQNWNLDPQSVCDLTLEFLQMMKTCIRLKIRKLIVGNMSTLNTTGNESLSPPTFGAILGMFRSLLSEYPEMLGKYVDCDSNDELSASQLFYEVWNNEPEPHIAYRAGIRKKCRIQLVNSSQLFENPDPLFDEKGSYLITGGCGGIGFQVAKWMITNGAKHLILTSRRPPKDEILDEISGLNKKGASIYIKTGDVGDVDSCKGIFQWISTSIDYPLKGIIHSAGNLSNATIQNQGEESYEATMSPKIRGTINLHKETLNLPPLEHFITFSSCTALIGSRGQSNHSGCSTFLDSFIQYRRSLGLPGLTINWGQWGEHGVVSGKSLQVMKPMSTREGLNALEYAIRTNSGKLLAGELDFEACRQMCPWAVNYLPKIAKRKEKNSQVTKVSSEQFHAQVKIGKTEKDKLEIIEGHVTQIIKGILKMEGEDISKTQNLEELGMDSLMRIELRNDIQGFLGPGLKMTGALIEECNSVQLTALKVLNLLESPEDVSIRQSFAA